RADVDRDGAVGVLVCEHWALLAARRGETGHVLAAELEPVRRERLPRRRGGLDPAMQSRDVVGDRDPGKRSTRHGASSAIPRGRATPSPTPAARQLAGASAEE